MKNSFQLPFKGIVPPMVTPLTADRKLDSKSLVSILEHIIKGGVQGVFILGTTGESASLNVNIREKLIEETLRIVDGRLPVFVGITDPSIDISKNLAHLANKFGADALVSAPPFYYYLEQSELIAYYQTLADMLPLPLFLYNMPSHTKMSFEINTVLKLSQHQNIIGLKDSSANSQYFQKLQYSLKRIPNFTLLVGPEEILAETVLMGADGGVPGGANLFPALYVELYEAALIKDFARLVPLHNLIMEISSNLYSIESNQSSFLKGLKTALAASELCENYLAMPLNSFSKADTDTIAKRLDQIKLSLSEVL